jgi:hypothetical protein
MYRVIIRGSDLCGNSTDKFLGYSKTKDYAFFELLFFSVVIEDNKTLQEKSEKLIHTADWRG